MSKVLAALFERLSENDQSRGLVVVIDSLERAVDFQGALNLLRTLCELPHVAVWITCRRSAWVRYEAAIDIDAKPVAEVAAPVAGQVLAGRGIATNVWQLPAFVRRAVNLDVFCSLHESGVLGDVPQRSRSCCSTTPATTMAVV